MDKKYYHVENKGNDAADIMIYGTIGDSWFEESVTAKQFVTDVRDLEKKFSRINVRINSPGGSVFDGLAIFNALKNSTAEIHTFNDGLAASMAAVVMMAGRTVHAAKNSLTMFHSPSTYAGGNRRDFEAIIGVLDKVQNSLVESILEHTDKKKEEIEAAYFDYKDHWLTAEEAMGEGFVDELDEKQASVSKKMAAKTYQEMVAGFSKLVPEKQPNKLVAFLTNLFATAAEPRDLTIESDMDIKQLQAALSLGDTATEQEVLDAIKKMATDAAAEKAAKDTAIKDLNTAKSALAQTERDLEALKKSPGAAPAAVTTETDKLDPEDDKPAGDFGAAFMSVMKTFKKSK